jgi:nicotinate-nucleotide pyrophosphorylase (carboxylating)
MITSTISDLANRSIDLFIEEDLGKDHLDITTESVIPADVTATASFLFKQNCVVAGLNLMPEIFKRFDPSVKIELIAKDGQLIENAPMREHFFLVSAWHSIFCKDFVVLPQ